MRENPDKVVVPLDGKQRNVLMIHERWMPTREAEFAMGCISAASLYGAGNPKVKMLNPKEVVERGMAIARLTFQALDKEGWISERAPYDEIQSAIPSESARGVGFRQTEYPA